MTSKGGMPEGMRGVMGWVLGLGIIAFILLVMVIIFGNLSGNVGFGTESFSFVNQTITLQAVGATPAGAQNRVNPIIDNSTIVMTNSSVGTNSGFNIESGNYTLNNSILIASTSDSTYIGLEVNVSYTVAADSQGLIDSNNIILNYTSSATNTSAQFPTVGTIVGIAILLLILIALLIFAIRKMMGVADVTGGGGSNASFGSSSGSGFSGSDREFS